MKMQMTAYSSKIAIGIADYFAYMSIVKTRQKDQNNSYSSVSIQLGTLTSNESFIKHTDKYNTKMFL